MATSLLRSAVRSAERGLGFALVLAWTPCVHAGSPNARHEFSEHAIDVDIDVDGTTAVPRKVAQDTVWIATWDFDVGAVCSLEGWEKVDGYVRDNSEIFWDMDASFDGTGGVLGTAAALGYENNPCCVEPDGYDNDWYQAIRIEYTGAGVLGFDYVVDSEGGFDFLHVEEDSACASFDRVDYVISPESPAASYRVVLYSDSGFEQAGVVDALPLTDQGPGVHCVYIAFFSDGAFSPCDGLQPTTLGKALIVDNIVIQDASGTRSEGFEDGVNDIGTFCNIVDVEPFGPTDPGRDGSWARVFKHITDNDTCTENTTCAVLWTDDTTPKLAVDPAMAFAPGGFVINTWLDDRIESPWVSLSSTPSASGTVIEFRRFPGNYFTSAGMVQNWSVRSKSTVDDGMGGVECVSGWGHSFQWNTLSVFRWLTIDGDMSPHFDPSAEAIQIRHRVTQWFLFDQLAPFNPGPGPFIDRTRIGRVALTGPVLSEGIDARSQAQDAYPTEIDTGVTPGTGEHHRPTMSRFGTTALSSGADLAQHRSPNVVTGDSITIEVQDVRGAGGVTRIEFYGAIVEGPHAGMAPPPYAPTGSGFFVVTADSARTPSGQVVDGVFYVDLDDSYFVGGDVLHYVWLAEDALGGIASAPYGLSVVPTSLAQAQRETNGLYEVSFLPAIFWDPDYLAAVAAGNAVDPQSDPAFLDQSTQSNCILYVNRINPRRLSGDVNRTSFMYKLDRLGYRGDYDVYDHTGMGSTNNHLGGRATIEQAQGYYLIVYDAGNAAPSGTIVPDGTNLTARKIDQAGWFRSWLAQAPVSEAGFVTLWILGSNVLQENPTHALYTTDMGVTMSSTGQTSSINPDCEGQTVFTFDVGLGSNQVDFATGLRATYSLSGGCPEVRHYDGLGTSGTAAGVYRYRNPFSGTLGDAAIVMNTAPAADWNTVFQSHPWFDIHDPFSTPADPKVPIEEGPEGDLMQAILEGCLPTSCIAGPFPTDHDERFTPAPERTVLHANTPNPFNPATTIGFDLARGGRVTLRVYDVTGRSVRTIVDEDVPAGRGFARTWTGQDDAGRRVASGVYFYRLDAPGFTSTKKMVLMQ